MDAAYLKATVSPILAEGVAALCRLQPVDPIDYLGNWLIQQAASLHAEVRLGSIRRASVPRQVLSSP